MSKPFPRSWPLIACALLAFTILLWWQSRPAPKPSPAHAPAPRAEPAPATASIPEPPAPDDPRRQLDAALQIPDPQQRAQEFGAVLQRWLDRDPEAALAYVRGLPRDTDFSQALLQTLHTIARRDPDRALALARELITTRDERFFYNALFDRFARENIPNALQRLALVPPEARENAIRALVDVWVRRDPEAALAWAQQLPAGAERDAALESALSELAARDPLRAVELARKSLSGAALARALSRAIQILTPTDPERAGALVAALPPGEAQNMAAMNVARVLAGRSIEGGLGWVKTLPIDFTRWLALNSVLSVWAQKDQAAAARYVLDMDPGQPQDFAARHLASLLAASPRDAIPWAEALPTESARESAFPMIASTWAQRAPADAARWAASLGERPPHTDTITAAFSQWMLQDAAAARAWVDTADLPAETKTELLRR